MYYFSYYLVRHYRYRQYKRSSGTEGLCVSTLSFLATVRIALVLGCECPRLWGWAKEHLGDLHPVAAISTC